MTNMFRRSMSKATDLTRTGRLQEATALIQSLLSRQPGTAGTATTVTDPNDDAVEGRFTRLTEAPPAAASPARPKRPARTSAGLRSGLSETLRKIASGGMPGAMRPSQSGVDMPAGAQFMSLTHLSAQGSRDYRLYVPAAKPATPMPLIVMLHGCTQTPEDFAAGTGMNALAEEFGCIIAYPAQPTGANAQKCWNWFRPADQVRDRGEPELIAGLTRDILRDHPVDAARVYVAGLSAGGAAAAIVASAYPDIFCAAGVHSGLPVGSAQDVPSAFAAMRSGAAGTRLGSAVPTISFHGSADGTVHPRNGAAVVKQALRGHPGVKPAIDTGTSTGGRTWRRTSHRKGDGPTLAEHWEVDGAGHAWSGGKAAGSYTDAAGPDASREMLRFFLQHKRG